MNTAKKIDFFESQLLPLKDVRVLLVDDSPDNLYLATCMLSKLGANVDLACNGMQAIEKALSNSHDIILMDLQMPVMNGYEALQNLLKVNYSKPVVAFTSMLNEEVNINKAGFSGYLTKPVEIEDLIDLVSLLAR